MPSNINSPKVSVIIPVYNVEKYLRECLDSVVNQTLKDIEIICVDDGSTDGSGAILDEYAAKDNRIKVITQENRGAGVARNNALNIATGEYLAILDSDDVYNISMLEKMYNKSIQHDLDIVICRSLQLDEKTKQITETNWTIKKQWLPQKDIFNCNDFMEYVIGFCVGWTWDKLFKRDFIEKYQLRFPALHNSEDGMFTFGALCVADKISVVDDVLVTHRTNAATRLSERRDESPECFIEGAKILKDFLEKNGKYKVVEQSFINWFVEHSYWHLDTLNLKNSHEIEIKLKSVFEEFGVFEHIESYFYYPNIYDKLKFMINNVPYCIYRSLLRVAEPASGRNSHKVLNILGIKIKIRRKI